MVPVAVLHVDGQHGHGVATGVLYELRGRVEAHRQTVEQAAVEGGGVVAFQPGGNVHQQCETGRVRLRKAIFAEALDLTEHPLGKVPVVAAGQHAVDEFLLEMLKTAASLPGGHGAAQLIGLATAETGSDHGEFDHLLLEDRYAQGALEHPPHGLARIDDRLEALPAPQIGVHHVALDGPGSDDGHLDHQIVEMLRLQARQHGHLGPGFHLEHADTVAPLQHPVGGRIFGWNAGHGERGTPAAIRQRS